METLFGYDFHPALREILDIHQQPTECETRSFGWQRDQQIDITGIVGVTPCHGPEHPHVLDSVAFGEGENLSAVLFDHGVHGDRILTMGDAAQPADGTDTASACTSSQPWNSPK